MPNSSRVHAISVHSNHFANHAGPAGGAAGTGGSSRSYAATVSTSGPRARIERLADDHVQERASVPLPRNTNRTPPRPPLPRSTPASVTGRRRNPRSGRAYVPRRPPPPPPSLMYSSVAASDDSQDEPDLCSPFDSPADLQVTTMEDPIPGLDSDMYLSASSTLSPQAKVKISSYSTYQYERDLDAELEQARREHAERERAMRCRIVAGILLNRGGTRPLSRRFMMPRTYVRSSLCNMVTIEA